jgi:predicted acetyltransferase
LEPAPSRLTLECRLAGIAEQVVLARMLELYQYELSDIWDQDVDDAGEYGYALSRYWERAKHFPYVALVDGKYAGFALVDGEVKLPGGEFWMDQFFVLKKYRRRGIGRGLARHVLLAHPGHWQIGQMPENVAAQKFWRSIVAEITEGNFEEHRIASGWWQGYVQTFSR